MYAQSTTRSAVAAAAAYLSPRKPTTWQRAIERALTALEQPTWLFHLTDDPRASILYVRSSRHASRVYVVQEGACTCPAAARDLCCYHRAMRGLLVAAALGIGQGEPQYPRLTPELIAARIADVQRKADELYA